MMNVLDRINWDDFIVQVKLVCRWCLGVVLMMCLGATVWVTSAWYTERKQALYAPVSVKVEVPAVPEVNDSAQRIKQLEQQIAAFKAKREREIADQQKRLAHYERQIQELTALLGDSDLQLQALKGASTPVPAMNVREAERILGVKARVREN